MLQSLSQTSKAFRDTTIHKSSGEWFRIVAEQYGIPFVATTLEDNWREVVRSNALGPRGSFGAVFQFVYWALKQFTIPIQVSVSASNPQRITLDASPSFPFIQNHIGMWVRRDSTGDVWRIVSPDDISTSSGNWVNLSSTTNNPYWVRANFTQTETFTAEILPFTIHEEPGLVVINVLPSSISMSPATYLQPGSSSPATPDTVNQEAGSEAASYNSGSMDPAPNASPLIGADDRPAFEPDGGHLQENEFEPGSSGSIGPYPIYLSSGGVFDEFQEILDPLLVAGVRCKFRLMPVYA